MLQICHKNTSKEAESGRTDPRRPGHITHNARLFLLITTVIACLRYEANTPHFLLFLPKSKTVTLII